MQFFFLGSPLLQCSTPPQWLMILATASSNRYVYSQLYSSLAQQEEKFRSLLHSEAIINMTQMLCLKIKNWEKLQALHTLLENHILSHISSVFVKEIQQTQSIFDKYWWAVSPCLGCNQELRTFLRLLSSGNIMQFTYHSLIKIFLQRPLNQKVNLTAYLKKAEQKIFKKPN